jgi:hypothetical protein
VDINQILMTILHAPVQTIFIVAGLVFLFLALVEFSGKAARSHSIKIAPITHLNLGRKLLLIVSALLLVGGILASLLPPPGPPPHQASTSTPTPVLITPTPVAESTPTTTPSPQATTGTAPAVFDPLQQNDSYAWLTDSTCVFREQSYHSLNSTPGSLTKCYANALPNALNTQHIAFQIEVHILAGNYGGIGFGTLNGDSYFFSINTANQYQVYFPHHQWFSCYNGPGAPEPQPGHLQTAGMCTTNAYVPTQRIKLRAVIEGKSVSFYINDTLQWIGPNLGISPGTIFLTAGFDQSKADFSFQNLRIWQLS